VTDEPPETTEQPKQRDVAKYVVIALAALVFATGLVVVLLPSKTPDIAYHVVAVELGDPKQVVVTFDVEKAPLASAVCEVTATGAKRDIVNRLTGITIGPSPGKRVTRHQVTVLTNQPATSAAVAECVVTRTR
jgi:hypothetical protein